MSRDWDAEWEVLNAAERKAFKAMNDAWKPLLAIHARVGAADMALLDEIDKRRKEWAATREAERVFMAEWHAAQRS